MSSLPPWAAIIASLLLILGGVVTLVGSLGLLRLRTFFQRMHAPTMGMTMGVFCVVLATTIISSLLHNHPILHVLLITVFLFMTAPVTAIFLMQSGIRRKKQRD